MLCGYLNFLRTGGFKEKIDKELGIFMANCLIFLKILRTVVIYRVRVSLFFFFWFSFWRIMIMNPKNLHDNCQGCAPICNNHPTH
jgi:hypothetical protein